LGGRLQRPERQRLREELDPEFPIALLQDIREVVSEFQGLHDPVRRHLRSLGLGSLGEAVALTALTRRARVLAAQVNLVPGPRDDGLHQTLGFAQSLGEVERLSSRLRAARVALEEVKARLRAARADKRRINQRLSALKRPAAAGSRKAAVQKCPTK
ncbi:unnamed protein product, partial [Polarella glacialis]